MLDRVTGLGIRTSAASRRIASGLRVVGGTDLPAAARVADVPADRVVIEPQETMFAALLFGLIPSPRAARRFAGVYRQIKAGAAFAELDRGADGLNGHYQVPMLLLAIQIGAPAAAERLFPVLCDAVAQGDDLRARLTTCSSVAPGLASMTMVEQIIRPIVSDLRFPASPRLFSVWLPRIARYTFDMTCPPRRIWLSSPEPASWGLPFQG